MSGKRPAPDYLDSGRSLVRGPCHTNLPRAPKRPRLAQDAPAPSPLRRRVSRRPAAARRTGPDLLSPLSDELLIRVLSFLSPQHLLAVAPVSSRFHRLSEDTQLWKALYYARFVLPRALRIPRFREGCFRGGQAIEQKHRLQFSGKRKLWSDEERDGSTFSPVSDKRASRSFEHTPGPEPQAVHWKRQYKIRHNWSRGKCAVEELRLGPENEPGGRDAGKKMLVKVIEGLAITADTTSGLRIWDLRSRDLVAQTPLHGTDDNAAPSCIAVDDCGIDDETIDVALGFSDGGFGVWKFDRVYRRLICRYRHEQSSNGELLGVAFSHPYLLTATGSVLISLYTFDVPAKPPGVDRTSEGECGRQYEGRRSTDKTGKAYGTHDDDSGHPPGRLKLPSGDSPQGSLSFALPAPYLLTSLRSHTSKPPLALAIRRTTVTTIASIAYTFSTRQGWVIGIQDLHIESSASGLEVAPEITATRLAYTSPVSTGSLSYNPATPPARPSWLLGNDYSSFTRNRDAPGAQPEPDRGPMTLCYNHPYLLATLPDNTLILHLCTSNASALSISPGIRLWGHTSGISDAEITARGKAVSVSSRGEEMRVWELEGRPSTVQSKSVEIRPDTSSPIAAGPHDATHSARGKPFTELDERRNWVGFDDEMVIVLKESQGEESLMVYDFT